LFGFLDSCPVSSTDKTDRHDISEFEILLKVVLNTITLNIIKSKNKQRDSFIFASIEFRIDLLNEILCTRLHQREKQEMQIKVD
jgi:hypothetical protein